MEASNGKEQGSVKPVIGRPRRMELSAREIDVAKRVVEGDSNKMIAYHLGIEEETVKVHMRSILKRLRLNNRVQLAVWVARGGLETSDVAQ